MSAYAGIAQLVERNLAKVEVASSSLVSRSMFRQAPSWGFVLSGFRSWRAVRWPHGRVAMHRIANPFTAVRFRLRPPNKALIYQGFFFAWRLAPEGKIP